MIGSWIDALQMKFRLPIFMDRLDVQRRRNILNNKPKYVSTYEEPRQLLLDVSVISKHDAGTGIQRVVRAIFEQLRLNPPDGFVICPVAADRDTHFHYIEWQGVGCQEQSGRKVCVAPGDVFFGLDFSTHAIFNHREQIAHWKLDGAKLYFLVHDFLPDLHPEWFSVGSVLSYRRWIKLVAIFADIVFCNSMDTKNQLLSYFGMRYGLSVDNVDARVLPMGWDITSSKLSTGLPTSFDDTLAKCRQRKTALMVGTIEPRKGHAQVLSAFEHLWKMGRSVNLVIVGRPGWKTESLQKKMRSHPEWGRHLFWLDNASDEALLCLYDVCYGVILASLAEGYGLPLIEALGHGKPVLARNLPVFHECAHGGVDFFSAPDGEGLAYSIVDWLEKLNNASVDFEGLVKLHSWNDTYVELISALQANKHKFEILEPEL